MERLATIILALAVVLSVTGCLCPPVRAVAEEACCPGQTPNCCCPFEGSLSVVVPDGAPAVLPVGPDLPPPASSTVLFSLPFPSRPHLFAAADRLYPPGSSPPIFLLNHAYLI